MKKLPVVMLSMLTLPVYAQGILNTLNQHQTSLKTPEETTQQSSSSPTSSSKTPGEVKPSTVQTSSSSVKCEENDQTSLPLAYVTSLIQQKDAKLDILHDPRAGKLTISSADMIGNCSSMLQWTLKKPEIQGKQAYAVEVKFRQGDACDSDGCEYKVAKVENGEFKEYQTMKLKPTLKGFEECLQKSGVIANGKVVSGAIYTSPVNEKFDGLNQSGRLLFLSHGPSTALVKPKYGKFEYTACCDFYEAAHPQIKTLLTYEDEEKERLDAEAAKLKDCKVDEYAKLADFIDKYEGYASQLGQVRDNLILEAVKKSAAAIASGKYTEDDLKVIADFDKYIVEPKVNLARALYEEMLDLEGDAKKAKQEQLKAVLAQISQLNQKPYFLSNHTMKLIQDGRFEEAEKLNTLKLVLDNHQRLGAKQDNVVITPGIASQRIVAAKTAFAEHLVKERERYEIRTGQVSGKSQTYVNLAARMRNNVQMRNQNFMAEIQSEYERMQQPSGYCYRYYRNTQKCIQESVERIQELQGILQHYNKVDEERAKEYDAQAKDYGELEAQGRRYIATQNGEAPEEPAKGQPSKPQDTTVPTPRAQTQNDPSLMQQQLLQQQQQMMAQLNQTNQMYQMPMTTTYGNSGYQMGTPTGIYQQPYMGQQAYNTQNMYGNYQMQGNYNMGYQQNPYMMQQQSPYGYWNQPYQAYGGYSIYGRTW